MKRLDTICLITITLLIGIVCGYMWRVQHESVKVARIADASQDMMILTLFEEAKNGKTFWYGDNLKVIPRKDGKITLEIKEDR